MHIYMLKRNNYEGVVYYVQGSCWGTQEEGTRWVNRHSAESAQKHANFPCEVVEFNLEPVEPVNCPRCGGLANVAHGSVQCISFLKSKVKKLTKQRDKAREERNKLLNEKYPPNAKFHNNVALPCNFCTRNRDQCSLCVHN